MSSPLIRLLILCTIAMPFPGCRPSGPAYWPISGQVTFRGQSVANGSIRISNPKAGVDIVAPLDADGRYTVVVGDRNGLPEGEYKVAVIPKLDFSTMKTDPSGRPIPSTMPSFEQRNPPNIPKKYHDPMTSGLVMTVEPEANTFDVDMRPAHD